MTVRSASASSAEKEVRKEPECQKSGYDFHQCAALARDETLEKINTRSSHWWYRFLAVHRNDEHFRGTACLSFNQMHGRAARLLEHGSPELALLAEAVAVHFLQDSMAPGHLATPRDQFGDWQAGAVHDRHNRRGLPATLSGAVCEGASRLLDDPRVDHIAQPSSWSHLQESKRLDWGQLREDLEVLKESCRSGHSYTAHGDRSLLPGTTDVDARIHAATVFYLTVAAMEDLYGIADRQPLRMHYDRPHHDVGAGQSRAPESGLWTSGTISSSLQQLPARGSNRREAELLHYCPESPRSGERLFSYETAGDTEQQESTALGALHLLNTVQIAYSSWGDARKRWEIAWETGARERLLSRLDDGSYEKADLWRKYLGVGSWSLHHQELADNDVWGLGLLATYSWHLPDYRDFDVYGRRRAGVRPLLPRRRLHDSLPRQRESRHRA